MTETLTKHQQYARTGHAPEEYGLAKGGSVHSSGDHSVKHSNHMQHQSEHGHHKGHGRHGHKPPHEHHHEPGAGHSGHDGHGIKSLVHGGHMPSVSEHATHTHEVETDGGGGSHNKHGMKTSGTGSTRNPV